MDDLLGEIHATVEAGDRVLVTTLTKRMAEDLTEFLDDHKVRVRYLHSISTPSSASKLFATCVWDTLTCWWGLICYAKGSICQRYRWWRFWTRTKRGFCAATSHSLQTIGRAARHIDGRAILYADKETGSMTRAMAETERRRNKQLAFNEENNITPKGIHKSVQDILEGARRMPTKARGGKSRPAKGDRASLSAEISHLTPAALGRKIADMEQKMLEHAKNLEFEEAAALRDEVTELKQVAFAG